MAVKGEMFIGGEAVLGSEGSLTPVSTTSGEALAPAFRGATPDHLDQACRLADEAFDAFRESSQEQRAQLLEGIARNVESLGDVLIERCMAESGLPRARLEAERSRTVGQLRMFADVVRRGDYIGARIDPAQPDRTPPRVDLRLRHIPVGPVAVFGASNFPLAFSVAGGDTASALAAGAPVVAKSHPAHPGTSELVGRAVSDAVRDTGLPRGVFSMLFDTGYEVGRALVADPRIGAVAFTGSRRGGLALVDIAARRASPIPVYAEMSSVNPAILFPEALRLRAEPIARDFVASLTLGAGQFCTNTGIVLAQEGEGLERFLSEAARLLEQAPAATMLTPGIHEAYETSVARVADHAAVETIARGLEGRFYQGRAGLFSTTPEAFLAYEELQSEIFGAAALVVRCPDQAALRRAIEALEGQLTATIHVEPGDHATAAHYLGLLERKAGRIVVNGFATGVEVGHAMVHGGPFPSTADGRSTSVGSLAISRFLRPVSYQNMPSPLLPAALQETNPLGLRRMVDGEFDR